MGLNPTGSVAFMEKALAVRMFTNVIPLDARLARNRTGVFRRTREARIPSIQAPLTITEIRNLETGTHRSGRPRYGVDTP